MYTITNFFRKSSAIQPNINTREPITTAVDGLKVALLGAMNSIGQPLSLLLKRTNLFREIALQDESDTDGLVSELFSIGLPGDVTSHHGKEALKTAMTNADIVIMLGGKTYHPDVSNFSYDDIYDNCKLVHEYSKGCVTYAPDAIMCILTGPITSTFAVASEVFKAAQKNFHYKVIGLNTLLSMRADLVLGGIFNMNNHLQVIPVIGGCTPKTSVPLISLAAPRNTLTTQTSIYLTQKYQSSFGIGVPSGENNRDVSSLSQAFAACEFTSSLAKTITSKQAGFIENAFVMTNDVPDIPCFGLPVFFGKYGVHYTFGLPKIMHYYEAGLLKVIKPIVVKEVNSGLEIYKKLVDESEKQVEVKKTLS